MTSPGWRRKSVHWRTSLRACGALTDLNSGSPHNGNIAAITDAGSTTGCEPTEYCPNANVTRQEMALFLGIDPS